jgi:hypothetical protein
MPIINTKTALLLIALLLLASQVQALVPPGRITVTSNPSTANACVDNTQCDSTTAIFTVEGNSWHTVTVTAAGYEPWSGSVFVTTGQSAAVNADLQINPDVTGIRVFVRPGGGNVCLDSVLCHISLGAPGSTGSTVFTGVSPGFHTVTVDSTDSFQDASVRAHVIMGSIATIVIDLTPASIPTGTIRVYVNPPGSKVCIDNGDCRGNVGGNDVTGTGFVDFAGVTVDAPHTISVTADGFTPASTQVQVGPERVGVVNVVLKPVPVTTPMPTPLPVALPSPLRTQSSPGLVPVLGGLSLCGVLVLFRKKGA